MLPGVNASTSCAPSAASSHIPVLMLTARGDEVDRIMGAELARTITCPRRSIRRELVARIRAVLRRTQPETRVAASAPTGSRWTTSSSTSAGARGRGGAAVELHPVEFALLELLMRRRRAPSCARRLARARWAATCCPSTAASTSTSAVCARSSARARTAESGFTTRCGRWATSYARRRAERRLSVRASSSRYLLWFWTSLVLVCAGARARDHRDDDAGRGAHARFSDSVPAAARARRWRSSIGRTAGVARFWTSLERTTRTFTRGCSMPTAAMFAGRVVPPRAIAVAARALDTGRRNGGPTGKRRLKAPRWRSAAAAATFSSGGARRYHAAPATMDPSPAPATARRLVTADAAA